MPKPKRPKSTHHLVLSDLHFPFQDDRALAIPMKYGKDTQPDIIHLLGDVLDCYSLSRFSKDPARHNTFQADLDATHSWLKVLRATCPNARIIYTEGNHEDRLPRYLRDKCPELASVRANQIPLLLKLSSLEIEWVKYDKPYRMGHLTFCHGGQVLRPHSAYTARGIVERVGGSVIQGDTHRLGAYHVTRWENDHAGWENGCLCRLDPEYTKGVPNWQHGFSIVHMQGKAPHLFSVQQVRITNGRALIDGKLHG